jgi:hypothetical protein
MAMSWQVFKEAQIADLRKRLQEAEPAPSPDCAHASHITIQVGTDEMSTDIQSAGTDEMSYLSQKLSVAQKSLSEASHLLVHLVHQLKETSSALSEAQDFARGDMLREAEHSQLVRMHALALNTKHATLEARIEELSMQLVTEKASNKQANILFDNLLLDHNDLVPSVQHQRQPSITPSPFTPSPLAPPPRPPSTPRPMTPRTTISCERAGAACRKACDACEDPVLERGESFSEPKRMLEFVQNQALAIKGPNHFNDTKSAERPGGGVVTAEDDDEEEEELIRIQHKAERARQHAGEALLSLSVILQCDATFSDLSVPLHAYDGGRGHSRSHVQEGAPGMCMCLCVCIAEKPRGGVVGGACGGGLESE